MIEPMTRRFRDSDTLLQQVSEILHMLRLLLQESRLDRILQGIVTMLVGRLAQAKKVLQEALLDLESLVDGLDGVDWIVGPGYLRGRDIRGLRAAATMDEVAL